VAIRAWAVLPASGSQEVGAAVPCAGWDWASFFFEYQRGGAGGEVWFQLEWSPYSSDVAGVENWFTMAALVGQTLAQGQIAEAWMQKSRIEYRAQFGGVECFVYGPIQFARTFERVRLVCGDGQTVPGNLKVTALFYTQD
jgi:hypothetical protein